MIDKILFDNAADFIYSIIIIVRMQTNTKIINAQIETGSYSQVYAYR